MTRRKDGTFQEQITIKINGVKKQKYFYGKSQSEIKKKIAAYTGKVEKGRLFSAVAEEWKEKHYENIEYKTRRSYDAPYKSAVNEFGDRYIREITSQEIDIYIKRISKNGYALRTVKAYLTVLNLIYDYAMINGDTNLSPTAPVKIPRGLKTTKRNMPNNECINTVKESVKLDFGLFPYFLLYTGCRRGEALALKYEDIDYEKNIIHITKSLYYENNKPVVKSPKTAAGNRNVILLDKLKAVLPKGKKNHYIFGVGKEPLSDTQFRHRWKAYCKETGLAVVIKPEKPKDKKTVEKGAKKEPEKSKEKITYRITPHQLRHGYATMLFEAGVDEKIAQDQLGHAKISTTKDIYTHLRLAKIEEASKQLNDYVNNNNM